MFKSHIRLLMRTRYKLDNQGCISTKLATQFVARQRPTAKHGLDLQQRLDYLLKLEAKDVILCHEKNPKKFSGLLIY